MKFKKYLIHTLVVIAGLITWLAWAVVFSKFISNLYFGVIVYVLVPTIALMWTILRYRKVKSKVLLTYGITIQASAVFIPIFAPALLILVLGSLTGAK